MSGFDRDEEAAFRDLFATAAVPGWALAPEKDADTLLFDIDSMYGQMGWLRAQGGSRPCAVLTAASRADTEHVLHRPLSADGIVALLRQLGGAASAEPAAPTRPDSASHSTAAVVPTPVAAAPATPAAAPEPIPVAPKPTHHEPAGHAAEQALAAAAAAAPASHRLLHYLDPDVLAGPVRLRDAEPLLAFDPHAFTYAGGNALKPLAEHCLREIPTDAWEALSSAEYDRLKQQLGGTQPLSRLRWLAGLYAHDGRLAPELAGSTRFKLGKWPQSEREYPKHFRIATALLKQPGSIEELATASGASPADVADFINACHAIGIIEAEGVTAPAAGEPARGSLMSRLRGKP